MITSAKGFSMLEMLVTLTILSVMAVLGIAASRTALEQMANTRCLSNLQQMGLAMASYCADNDDYLPGPAYSTLPYSFYTRLPNTKTTLAAYLGPYLGVPTEPWRTTACEIMICPAYKKNVPAIQWTVGFSYMACLQVTTAKSESEISVSPWGRPDGATKKISQTPLRRVSLGTLIKPSETWAIQDADALSYGSAGSGIAPGPVHINHRNQLFFDFHVESVLIK